MCDGVTNGETNEGAVAEASEAMYLLGELE